MSQSSEYPREEGRVGRLLKRIIRRGQMGTDHASSQPLAGRSIIESFGEAYPEAFFVEIGSNDGDQHDHLKRMIDLHDWSGIMVEPVPYVFRRLERNYADRREIRLENVAVAGENGELPFYYLREASEVERAALPDWYDAIGSFSRENVVAHAGEIADLSDRLQSMVLPCVTFETLCVTRGVTELDLLVIDAEGFDWKILSTIDLERFHPRLIVFEHFHLSDEERAAARRELGAAGYELMEEHLDTFCLDVSVDDTLTHRLRELEPVVPALSKRSVP